MKEFFEKGLLDPLELMARQVLAVLPSLLAMSIIFFAGLVVAWTASEPRKSSPVATSSAAPPATPIEKTRQPPPASSAETREAAQ